MEKTIYTKIHKIVVGALRETIRAHGTINKLLIGSAAKRITSTIIKTRLCNKTFSDCHNDDNKTQSNNQKDTA